MNTMIRRIFWRNTEEVTGMWWEFHNEQHRTFMSVPNINEWSYEGYEMGGTRSTHGGDAYLGHHHE